MAEGHVVGKWGGVKRLLTMTNLGTADTAVARYYWGGWSVHGQAGLTALPYRPVNRSSSLCKLALIWACSGSAARLVHSCGSLRWS